MPQSVDYVIVGAGTAGCILAARLSESQDVTVALLELGGPDTNPAIWAKDVASMLPLWAANAPENWGYRSVAQDGLQGRAIDLPRGKVLGGCSAVNAMIYIRGNWRDYDNWQHLGNPGWGYSEVLAYFKKSEGYHGPTSAYHGYDGPVSVIDYKHPSPVSHAFIEAAAELGARGKYNDFNGAEQDAGAGFYQSTRTPGGVRVAAASAYLTPHLQRTNLHVLTNVRATRLMLSTDRVFGVEYTNGDVCDSVTAEREVVLCCGAFETPKLMMLSGMGPADELARNGIRVVCDLPGVGKNLQDHVMLGVAFASKVHLAPPALLAEAGLFTRSPTAPRQAAPNLQYFFGPLIFMAHGYVTSQPGFTFAPVLVQPQSRGTVTLASTDPTALARVDAQYLTCDADIAVLEHGVNFARDLAHTRPFGAFRDRELAPGRNVRSGDDLRAFIRTAATTVWHPCGTCKMGIDSEAVVDDQLRVRGVSGLRIADASIMPRLVTGNPNAAVMMIAERAADLIKAPHAYTTSWGRPYDIADLLPADLPIATAPLGLESHIARYREQVLPLLLHGLADREPKRHLYDLVVRQLSRRGNGLRAALCLATCAALGGNPEHALPSAAAIELVHNAGLVHDDVEESEHAGVPSMLRRRYGMPLAVNAGDAMIVLCTRVLRQNITNLDASLATRILDEFERAHTETLEGRALAHGWGRTKTYRLSEDDYLLMILKKISWYSFIHPLRIGALIASPERTDLDAFNTFGSLLGLALQIRDEIRPFVGDGAGRDGDLDADLPQGERTFALTHLFRVGDTRDNAALERLLAKPPERRLAQDVAWFLGALQRHGSIEYAHNAARDFAAAARREFDTVYRAAAPGPDLDFLRSTLDSLVHSEIRAAFDAS